MTDLRRFVCWDRERVITTIHTEAVVASRELFLATHTPLRIQRSQIRGRNFEASGEFVSEGDVLKDFLGRKAGTGTLLVPVVGDSGSGKSHLVRWIKERIPASNTQKIVYLEKSKTSLRHVIEALLEGVDHEDLRQLKLHLREFSSNTTPEALARELILALNLELTQTVPANYQRRAKSLAGPKGLALLLQDPHVQEYMLAVDQFIPRFAREMLQDRAEGQGERPSSFRAQDLPIRIQDHERAAAATKQILGLLISSPELRTAAVDMLNEHWEKAVKRVSSLGAGRIQDAMLTVRQAYAAKGVEIILLIEDFALIQGVQRDLLDAITESSYRAGKTVLAPMRTLMAITSGYFHDLPETALTRIAAATSGYVYDLDVTFSADQDGADQITQFFGRYLNAARLGRHRLEDHDAVTPPNHCDACPLKPDCHDAFGVTPQGYGLYPFNRSALLRMVHAKAPKDRPWSFVPRTALGSVIRPVLEEGCDSIPEGTFPDPAFRKRYPTASIDSTVPIAVSSTIHSVDEPEAERRIALLEFWGDAHDEAMNLPAGVAEAFSLSPLALPDAPARVRPVDKDSEAQRPTPAPALKASVPPSVQKQLDAVERWAARGTLLPTAQAATVRSIVSRAVVYRQDWLVPPVKPLAVGEVQKAGWTVKSNTVSIEQAGAESLASGQSPITFKRTPINGEFFKNLILLAEGKGTPRPDAVLRLTSLADRHGATLREHTTRGTEVTDEDLVAGLRISLLGAALAGRAHPGMDEEGLFSVAFDTGTTWGVREDHSSRTDAWMQALEQHRASRRDLVDQLRRSLGLGQGAGEVKIIDAVRARPLLRRASEQWVLGRDDPRPEWARAVARPLLGWQRLLTAQHAHLRTMLEEIRSRMPKGGDGAESTLTAVEKALDSAKEEGLVASTADAVQLAGLLERLRGADWRSLLQLESDLNAHAEDVSEAKTLVRGAAPLRSSALGDMEHFLVRADEFLSAALQAAANRAGSGSDSSAVQVSDLLAEWEKIASGLGDDTQESM